jgi:hypothetical protein
MLFAEALAPLLVEQRPLNGELWSTSAYESVESGLDASTHDQSPGGFGCTETAAHVDPCGGNVGRRERAAQLDRCITRSMELALKLGLRS